MAEYIEREALQNLFNNVSTSLLSRGELAKDVEHMVRAFLMVTEMIQDAPAADVAPVRHGRWVHCRYENCSEQFEIVKCSCCGHEAYAMAFYVRGGNYCPNCGARMDGAK